MSLPLIRQCRQGRTIWTYTSAVYLVRIEGSADFWCATIKDRASGRMVEYLDRNAFGQHFVTRELVAAAARKYIVTNPVPKVPA